MKAELARRQSLKSKLREALMASPGYWFTMRELALIGGIGGWRTRLSELGREGLHIEWNGKAGDASRHRFLPHVPLGPSAESVRVERHPAIQKDLPL